MLRTHILENVNLYAEKYDEDFVDFFATFAEDIWYARRHGRTWIQRPSVEMKLPI